MRVRSAWLGATLVAWLACTPGEHLEARPVFRHLGTTRGDIRLGAPLDSVWLRGSREASDVVSLPSGSVPGAQSVSVTRGGDARVREIMLNYEQATDFAAQVAGYRRSLGPPASHLRPADPEGAERIVWRDSHTSFELVRDPRRSASTIYGRLADRTEPASASPTGEEP